MDGEAIDSMERIGFQILGKGASIQRYSALHVPRVNETHRCPPRNGGYYLGGSE